ncbi:hypothetical protein ACFVIB_35100, partial [Streptomyces nigra]|uniref:hypothetical protein n=1 Tax=Streptomyces nigra TaxID=1827580 RepID=UPI003639615E
MGLFGGKKNDDSSSSEGVNFQDRMYMGSAATPGPGTPRCSRGSACRPSPACAGGARVIRAHREPARPALGGGRRRAAAHR